MKPFDPPQWIRHRHLQTVWSTLFRCLQPPNRQREKLELPDGDFVNLDHVTSGNSESPLVILLHGLSGSGDSIYITGMQHALHAAGMDSVTLIFRSAGGMPNRLARSYHAGDTGDIAFLIDTLAMRFPNRAMMAIGYSLGGNVILKYLGERGHHTPLSAAVSISAPLSLADAADQLDRGFSRVYRNRLLRELLHNIAAKQAQQDSPEQRARATQLQTLGPLSEIKSLRTYDNRIIAPLHGFHDADDYYAQSSAADFLDRIRIPTLLVHALDDPFMTAASAPQPSRVASAVTLCVSPHGGHVGFVHGTPWHPRYWLEETIPGWLSDARKISNGPKAPGAR